MEDTAVNLAHRHANIAEEYEEKGQLAEAIEAHVFAAEQFLLATQDTQSSDVIRTLKLMNAKHLRQAKDLQRKLAKQVAAAEAAAAAAAAAAVAAADAVERTRKGHVGSKKDSGYTTFLMTEGDRRNQGHPPMLGRRRSSSEHQHYSHPHQAHYQHHHQHHHQHQHHKHSHVNQPQHYIPTHPQSHPHYHRHYSSNHSNHLKRDPSSALPHASSGGDVMAGNQGMARTHGGGAEPGASGSYIGSSSGNSSNSSSSMIEESYTLVRDHLADDTDPFNKFWEAVENLVHKISSPVAFTSIPLTADDPTFGSILQSPSSEDPPSLTPTTASDKVTPVLEPEAGPSPAHAGTATSTSTNQYFKNQGVTGTSMSTESRPIRRPSDAQRPPKIRMDPSAMQESYFIIDSPSSFTNSGSSRVLNKARSSSESGSSAKSGTVGTTRSTSSGPVNPMRPKSTRTLEEYALENEQLKLALDRLSKRNMKLEKHIEGAMQMSVWQKDIQRSALQLIKNQDMLRPSISASVHLAAAKQAQSQSQSQSQLQSQAMDRTKSTSVSTLSASTTTSNHFHTMTTATRTIQGDGNETTTGDYGRDVGGSQKAAAGTSTSTSLSTSTAPENNNQYLQMSPMTMQERLKAVTEELETLKIEYSKQTALMKKYKQRWEDLKESAKKRRNGGSASASPQIGSSKTATFMPEGTQSHLQQQQQQQQPHTQPQQVGGINPYSSSALAGNPGSPGKHVSGHNDGSTRPMITLARSSSASGPLLPTGGTYQRRILMEHNKGGYYSGHHNANYSTQGSGIASGGNGGGSGSTTARIPSTLANVPEAPSDHRPLDTREDNSTSVETAPEARPRSREGSLDSGVKDTTLESPIS
ncbi:hypothetical protein BGZ94_007344 [Podila epigama]|nr:hypothetical protein BGZ94_007344 [Podila epigama]